MTTPTATLATPAWILAGRLRNVPGVLVADKGRLEFHTDSGTAFAAPIGEVGPVTWPWWWWLARYRKMIPSTTRRSLPNGSPRRPTLDGRRREPRPLRIREHREPR